MSQPGFPVRMNGDHTFPRGRAEGPLSDDVHAAMAMIEVAPGNAAASILFFEQR